MFEKTYDERTEAIQGGLEKAQKAQAEAEQKKAEYTAKLADAHEAAAQIRQDAQASGEKIKAQIMADAQADANRLVDQAHAQIEADRSHALVSLRGEIGGMATDLAEKIVGESLADEQRTDRVVESFIRELETSGSATR